MNSPLIVFSIGDYADLHRDLCAAGGYEPGELEARTFPDGEHYRRVLTPVMGREVALLGGTVSDEATLEVYDLACALVMSGAHCLTLIVPYFGYSTMERAVKPGEVVTAKTRARLLSSIPQASLGNRVVMLDLHSEGIPHYFEGPVRRVHLYAKRIVIEAARRLGGEDFVLACTDAGRAKWVESLANDIGVPASFVFKRRLGDRETEVTAVSAQVQGRRVIIYDDMIRTGSSLINAAKAYKAAGATEIAAVATHGLFPGDALSRLEATGLFKAIVCTDSHPQSRALASDFLQVESIVPLLVEQLKTGW